MVTSIPGSRLDGSPSTPKFAFWLMDFYIGEMVVLTIRGRRAGLPMGLALHRDIKYSSSPPLSLNEGLHMPPAGSIQAECQPYSYFSTYAAARYNRLFRLWLETYPAVIARFLDTSLKAMQTLS
jgi:hypothetical protein